MHDRSPLFNRNNHSCHCSIVVSILAYPTGDSSSILGNNAKNLLLIARKCTSQPSNTKRYQSIGIGY